MEYQNAIYEKEKNIAIVTLNRPKQMNSIDMKLIREIEAILEEVEGDNQLKVVIISGGDNRFFSAGADLGGASSLITSPIDAYRFSRRYQTVFKKMEDLGKPIIAAVNGLALGGGCELALACDFRIASEKASFGVPEVNLGALPGGGGTQKLPRLLGAARAKELLLLGDPIDAKEAYRIGLVNKVVPQEALMDEAKKLALKLASKPLSALRAIKSLVNTGPNMDLASALELESQTFAAISSSEDLKEGLSAFLEKRKPNFKGV